MSEWQQPKSIDELGPVFGALYAQYPKIKHSTKFIYGPKCTVCENKVIVWLKKDGKTQKMKDEKGSFIDRCSWCQKALEDAEEKLHIKRRGNEMKTYESKVKQDRKSRYKATRGQSGALGEVLRGKDQAYKD